MDNAHDEYTADILSFIEENVVEQPNEEQLQDVHASPALKTALSQVLRNLAPCTNVDCSSVVACKQ